MADTKFDIKTIGIVVSVVLSVGSAAFAGWNNQNKLEYMTKADFNVFENKYIERTVSSEASMKSGFEMISTQLSNLNVVSREDFQVLKDKTTNDAFELQKAIDFLKRDIELAQRTATANSIKIQELQTQLAILEKQKKNSE